MKEKTMKNFIGLAIVAAAVTVSGCVGSSSAEGPEIVTGEKEINLNGNSTSQLEVWVSNGFKDRPASFTVNVSSPEIVDVEDSSGEEVSTLDMGQAASGSTTVKKVVIIRGNPDVLGSLNSGTDQIQFRTMAETTGNLTEEERTAMKNVTVTVQR